MKTIDWVVCRTCKHEFYTISENIVCDWCHGTDIRWLTEVSLFPKEIAKEIDKQSDKD